MTREQTKPTWAGNFGGETVCYPDGSYWIWHLDTSVPKKFKVHVGHLPLYDQPLATDLTAEEMHAMMMWLLKDPRCVWVKIEALPPPGDWHCQSAPEVVQEHVNDQTS